MSFVDPITGGPAPAPRPTRPIARLYLAGASAEIARVREVADALVADGHTFTEAWWERMADAAARGWKRDVDVPPAYLRESWKRNMHGVREAQLLVALCRREGGLSPGTSGEVSYALGLRDGGYGSKAPTVLVCGDARGALAATDPGIVIADAFDAARIVDEVARVLSLRPYTATRGA